MNILFPFSGYMQFILKGKLYNEDEANKGDIFMIPSLAGELAVWHSNINIC